MDCLLTPSEALFMEIVLKAILDEPRLESFVNGRGTGKTFVLKYLDSVFDANLQESKRGGYVGIIENPKI